MTELAIASVLTGYLLGILTTLACIRFALPWVRDVIIEEDRQKTGAPQ